MKKHIFYNLWIHDDDELAVIAESEVRSRETLREWPLSYVERVNLKNGSSRVYKAQKGSGTEYAFYRTVQATFIPKAYFCSSDGDAHWMLLEDIDGCHPVPQNSNALFDLGILARSQISSLGSECPCKHDLSKKGYSEFVDSTVGLLLALLGDGKLTVTSNDAINRLSDALSHPEVNRAVNGKGAVLHGDLKCDNILIRHDGEIMLIDWQNVMFGPEMIDVYSLLATQAVDPVSVAGIGPEILRLALEIRWFADCLNDWMPDATFLDAWIANTEAYIPGIIENNGYNGREVYYFH
ncbi:MAG: aminoglycoside phosphotransferase family protein [Coriobacteriales bacterium]|jgi:serine/threonine protein kinase|nr:aminoglycoside phosphotransferase family protein [Coriobacteriales bacterium]